MAPTNGSRFISTVLSVCFLVLLCAPTAVTAKKVQLPCAKDPFANPKQDICNPLRYIASNVLTGIAFSLILAVAVVQAVQMRRYGARWMSAMTIGAFCFAVGIGCRFGLHSNPQGKGLYIAEYLFVVLSPCAFIAADYVLLGRLARYLESDRYLLIRPKRIVIFFICSDVTTFLIQAGGGSVLISANDEKTINTGDNIFLAGLAIQLASFAVFTAIYLLFLFRVRTRAPQVWNKDAGRKWYQNWLSLAAALFVSCIGILIRSVYRTIEIHQGFRGKLGTTESYFYGLDTLPLFVAIAVFVPFWPGRFIPPVHAGAAVEEKSEGSVETATEAPPPVAEPKVNA